MMVDGERLEWEVQGYYERSVVPDWALYHAPVSANGLHVSFYPNPNWEGDPHLERIDPILDTYYHHLPMARPYSAIWSGWLNVPETGEYGFGVYAVTSARVEIDSETVLQVDLNHEEARTAIYLEAGQHRIEVYFVDETYYSRLHLYWLVDDGGLVPIPSEALVPFLPQDSPEYTGVSP